MPPAPTAHLTSLYLRADVTPTRANLGPLTTAFALPSHCSRVAISGTNAIRGQTCRAKGTGTAEDDTGCWPRATAYPTAAVGASSVQGLGFYSPGVMCPTGYATACSQVIATGAAPQVTGAPVPNFAFQFPLIAGETAIGCCPGGYQCAMQGGAQTCHQIATSTALDAMTCEGAVIKNLDAFQVPFTAEGKQVQKVDMWAPLIQINHMLTDLPASTSIIVTPTPSSTPASSTATVMTNASASTSGQTSGTSQTTKPSATTGGSVPSSSNSVSGTSNAISASASTSGSSSSQKILGNIIATPIAFSSSSNGPSSSATSGSASGSSVSSSSSKSPSNSAVPGTPSSTGIMANIIPTPPIGGGTAATKTSLMTASGSPGSPSTPTASAPPKISNAAADVQNSTDPEPAPPMPTGAKVGIAFLPIAAAAMLITWALYRWHRKNNDKPVEEPEYLSKGPEVSGPDPSPYNDNAEQGRGTTSTVPVDYAAAFAARRNTEEVKYNGVNPHYVNNNMVHNGPGPSVHNSVIVPYGYAHDPALQSADNQIGEQDMHYYGDERDNLVPAPLEPAHFRNVSLGTDTESVDSPIDGTSPFRLKRADTLRKKQQLANGPVSPTDRSDSAASDHSDYSGTSSPSHEGSEYQYNGLKRENSFSRPRPSRPKTGASSIYSDVDRETRILSWNNGDSPMPPLPSPALLATVMEDEAVAAGAEAGTGTLQRNRSFSRPLKPSHEEVKQALSAVATGQVTPPSAVAGGKVTPPVTHDGVAF